MAIPTFIAHGSNGSGSPTPSLPAGWAAGDIFLLFGVDGDDPCSTPSGWNLVMPRYSTGGDPGGLPWMAPGADHALGMFVWWRRATSSESAPTLSGVAHQGIHAVMAAFRGCIAAGDPVESAAWGGGNWNGVSCPAGATASPDCLVVNFVGDTATGRLVTSYTNADLASLTERFDANNGSAGNPHFATGGKAAAGAFGATSVVLGGGGDGNWGGSTIVLRSQLAAQPRASAIII